MGDTDANEFEGRSSGFIPIGGSTEVGQILVGGEIGSGSSGTGFGGAELSSDSFTSARSSDFDVSDNETPKKRRGRPPGSKSKPAGKLPADKLAGARRKFTDLLAGAVGFGFSFYGHQRAKKYLKYSPLLAQQVYNSYQITKEDAIGVGEPLADTFILWFPSYVEPVSKGIDPALSVGRAIALLQKTSNQEAEVVKAWQIAVSHQPQHANGNTPPASETEKVEETINEWMKDNPTPQDLST